VLHHVMGRRKERGRVKDIGISRGSMVGVGRSRKVTEARAALAYAWVRHLGRSGHELAKALAVVPRSVYAASNRLIENNLVEIEDVERWCR
jgi:hypothetical protein